MRYWLLRDRVAEGPFSPDALVALPDFDPGLLVCPEDRPTAERSNWQPARKVPEVLERLVATGKRPNAPPPPPPRTPPGRGRAAVAAALAVAAAVAAAILLR